MKGYYKKIVVFLILVVFLISIGISVSAISSEEEKNQISDDEKFSKNVDSSNSFFRKKGFFSIERFNFFPDVELKNFKVCTRWVDENDTVFEKTSSLSTSGALVDVNDDGVFDVEVLFDFGLKIVEVEDSDFSSLNFPYVLGFVTNVQTVRTSDGCVDSGRG